jgi:DNA adenine methylase
MHEHVSAYLSAVEGLPACVERLLPVELRNWDFRKFLHQYDHPRALHHLDPPYLFSTRTSTGEYGEHEMSAENHRELLQILADIQGKFMLHGYPSDLYNAWAAYHGWRCDAIEIDNKAASAAIKPKRTECIWMNY